MCFKPVQIPNPNFAPGFVDHHDKPNAKLNIGKLSAIKNPLDSYIYVPCGSCDACRTLYQLYTIQRFREHSRGKWVLFCTATYQNSALPIYRTTFNNGTPFEIPYADFRDFRLMIKRIRKNGLVSRNFTYWCTSEFGNDSKHPGRNFKTNHRPHYHYFIFFEKQPNDTPDTGYRLEAEFERAFKKEWKRNISKSTKYPVYVPLSKFIKTADGRGTYDVHLLTRRTGLEDVNKKQASEDDPIFYASAYSLRYDKWAEKIIQLVYNNVEYDEYRRFKRTFRPHVCCSIGFGISPDTEAWITDCINWSLVNADFFVYRNQETGQTFPLARYYRNRYLGLRQYLLMSVKNPDRVICSDDGELLCLTQPVPVFDAAKLAEIEKKSRKFAEVCTNLRRTHQSIEIDYDN